MKLCREGNATRREKRHKNGSERARAQREGEREGDSRVRQVRNSSNLKG